MTLQSMNIRHWLANKLQREPHIYQCPHCHGAITRLFVVGKVLVRRDMKELHIGCRDCHRSHILHGNSSRVNWLALQLAKHPGEV